MNIIKSIKNLTKTEKLIWSASMLLIVVSSYLGKESDVLTVIASLLGATALIFVGKGDVIGQLLTIVFAVVYSVISYQFRYYGEMITYVGMTAPSALWAMITWLKNPYSEREVKVGRMTGKKWLLLIISTVVVTIVMGILLALLNTANLVVSIISITTSFLASMLTVLRSPYYAIAYAVNDVILITLWVLATIADLSYFPMVICFVVFFVNDIYGFYNWRRMRERQISQKE